MPHLRSLAILALALLSLGLLASCNTPGGTLTYRFTFDETANSQAFASMPEAVPIRGRLTLEGGANPPPTPPQVRLQYRYVAENGNQGPWQDGPSLRLSPDQGGYQAEATLEGIWPTGLDVDQLRQRRSVQLRALLGNQELAISRRYPVERVNPLWVRVFREPSVFWSVELGDNRVCGVGGTAGQDKDPLAWCLDRQGQAVHEIRETGQAWGYLGVALAGDGTIYTLPSTGPIRAFKDGAFTDFSLNPRGVTTVLAVDEGALYVGGALYKTNANCSVKRLYVDRYRLADRQREASLEFDASQAREDPAWCEINNSAPAHLRAEGGRLYMVYAVKVGASYDSNSKHWYFLNRMGMAALKGQDLTPLWLKEPPERSFSRSTSIGSVVGWFLYWGSPSNCSVQECPALPYAVSGFDLSLEANWLWASLAENYLNPQDGGIQGQADYPRFQILLEGVRFGLNHVLSNPLPLLHLSTPISRYVVLGTEAGWVGAVRRHHNEVYAVGEMGGKGFIARLH